MNTIRINTSESSSPSTSKPSDPWGNSIGDYSKAADTHGVYAISSFNLVNLESKIKSLVSKTTQPPSSSSQSPNLVILDLSTGPGVVAIHAARAIQHHGGVPGLIKIIAVDNSVGMLRVCNQKVTENGFNNIIDCQYMDCMDLHGIPSNSVDIAFSQFGIMYYDDLDRGLHELLRVLRKPSGNGVVDGGVAVITTWHRMGTVSFIRPSLNKARQVVLAKTTVDEVSKTVNHDDDEDDGMDLDTMVSGNPLKYNTNEKLLNVLQPTSSKTDIQPLFTGFRHVDIHRVEYNRSTTLNQILNMYRSRVPVISELFQMYGVVVDPDTQSNRDKNGDGNVGVVEGVLVNKVALKVYQDDVTRRFRDVYGDHVGMDDEVCMTWIALQAVVRP